MSEPADGTAKCSKCARSFSKSERFCPYDGTVLKGAPLSGPGVEDAKPADPLIGRVLAGRYKIERPVGTGGMANVYVARHTMLDRVLAVKVLKKDLPPSSRAADRFRREARAASRIEQENIVFLTDFGVTEDGLLFMVMEFVDGVPLGKLIKRDGAMPWRRATRIALQIARALQAAHGLGIIHRDLKPENLVIVDAGKRDLVKVLDFGIAKFIEGEDNHPNLTRAGMVFGTPEYMSPEHAQGLPLDGGADLYALGLILWECLTGRRAIQGRTAPETMALQLKRDPGPPSLQAKAKDIPRDLDTITCRLIDKKRAKRPADATEVIEALESLLQHAATAAAAASAEPAKHSTAPERPRKRQPMPTVLDVPLARQLRVPGDASPRVSAAREPREAREALVCEMAEDLWPEENRTAEVERAMGAYTAAQERLLDVETDLALVEDNTRRIRRDGEAAVIKALDEHKLPGEIAAIREAADGDLIEQDVRAELLRLRADRVERDRQAALTTVALFVALERHKAPNMAKRFDKLDRINREVALTSRFRSLPEMQTIPG